MIYNETNDDRKFDIELDNYPIGLRNFEMLNVTLLKYGLHFFKEKRIEKLKHVHFR